MSARNDAGNARPPAAAPRPSLKQTLGLDRHPLTRGKVGLLLGAAVMMALGVALTLSAPSAAESAAAPPAAPAGESAGGGAGGLRGSGFAESRSTPPPAADAPAAPAPAENDALNLHDLSPFMLKGGFGLFIGFSIGFAIRAFLRLAVVITGFYFLVLSMMAYAGWVDIHWDLMGHQFSHLAETLGAQFESFKTFLTGAIPASGLTLTGLVAGLRRK
jgi:uncharacterized membrane protein (Fun14 family)